ncbi:MAG: ester cyclase [Pseudomonadota bacterium]
MHDFRSSLAAQLDGVFRAPAHHAAQRLRDLVDPEASVHVSAPFGSFVGPEAITTGLILPLRTGLAGCHRRDLMVIGGDNRRDTGGRWVAILTHYVGTFAAPIGGLEPSGKLSFLRAGEFYQIDAGRITRAHIILDVPDLAGQSGRLPFPQDLGTELMFPAPATQDGICPVEGDGIASLDLVEAMLGDLHVYEPGTAESPGQTGQNGYWAEDFLWYGPGGVGSNFRWDGFVADHRTAFLNAFPDRKGGDHYCRIGDGHYAAVSGWPSMAMTHKAEYLGTPATNKALTLRVMDFYRCKHTSGGPRQIAENWVCLDYVDLFEQLGVDLIGRANRRKVTHQALT